MGLKNFAFLLLVIIGILLLLGEMQWNVAVQFCFEKFVRRKIGAKLGTSEHIYLICRKQFEW